MTNIIIELSKYAMIILLAVYTYRCFSVFSSRKDEEDQKHIYKLQKVDIFLIHLVGYIDIYLMTGNLEIWKFYGAQLLLFGVIMVAYGTIYKKAPKLVINNMCMLLVIGMIMLTRLDYDLAVRQFEIAVVASLACLLIPFLIRKITFLDKLTWGYAGVGLLSLAIVAVLGSVSYGAKLSFTIAGITIQPSEFVKILFVFFVAAMLTQSTEFRQLVVATIVAAMHVLVLVTSKDLGAALIFFVVYLVMLYVATRKVLYFIGGFGVGAVGAVVAYFLFSHVQTRVIAWEDPFAVIDGAGYQVAQSLFAIGSGGWFGSGLYQGMPDSIPVVEQDFIFSAIAEELGTLFAICVILVCVSCFFMFLNIAMQIKTKFYKLIALGLGTVYIFQVFLTVGGVTKFIPSTGVTLPLVSYGGSSLLSTFIIFNIIQGIYILKQDEGDYIAKEKEEKEKRRPKTVFDEEYETFQS